MAEDLIARRYASALFEVARDNDAIDDIGAALTSAIETIGQPQIMSLLLQPSLASSKKKETIELSLPDAPSAIRNVLLLMVEKRRIAAIQDLGAWYARIVDAHRGIVRATVTTAVPLEKDELRQMEAKLGARTGKTVVATNQVDPGILGGAVIHVADHIIDSSIKTRLATLGLALTQPAALMAAQS